MGDLKKILSFVFVALILLIFFAVAAYVTGFLRGESIKYLGGNGSDGICNEVPAKYRTIFESAGEKWEVQPAFLAAIFTVEHGRNLSEFEYQTGYTVVNPKESEWPEKDGDPNAIIKWPSSGAGALGPFQFMPATWEGHKEDGNGDGKMDVQNITDAAFGAAHKLAMSGAGGNTRDGNVLREAAAHYNGGTNPPQFSYDVYAKAVLEKFNQFYCSDGGGLIQTIKDFILRILNYRPTSRMSPPGPTAVFLHWSGGSTLESLTSTLEQRNISEGVMCQLGIDKDGTTYQFMRSLDEIPGCQAGGNPHGIGIEIVGVGKNDLMNNEQQFQGVVKTVKALMDAYSIPAINDVANQRGIIGHYQITPGKSDPSEEYLFKVINAVK